MAEIVPFRGVLYDPAKVGDLAPVMAPPYDVIGPAEQAALHARHPANVIRLELGQEHSGDTPANNRYTRARQVLDDWMRSGILRRDDQPAIYLYSIRYALEPGELRTMRGFLALVALEEYAAGGIFPHENTREAAKSDRYQLLEACRSNFSPVFSLYSDPDRSIIESLEKAVDEEKPHLAVADDEDVQHRLWRVTDEAVLSAVMASMISRALFIADGHHRYESALRYKNAQRAAAGVSGARLPSDFVLMYCSNLDDPGLTILPTHRLIRAPLPFSLSEVRRHLPESFTLQTFPFTKDTEAHVRRRFLAALRAAQMTNAHALGLIAGGEDRYDLLTLSSAGEAKLGGSARDHLDVSVLQQLVFHEAMKMTPADEERLLYMKDEKEAFHAVANGDAEVAILLNPPKITEVKEVAHAGERMPHKSTYFSPKPLTGLVIHAME